MNKANAGRVKKLSLLLLMLTVYGCDGSAENGSASTTCPDDELEGTSLWEGAVCRTDSLPVAHDDAQSLSKIDIFSALFPAQRQANSGGDITALGTIVMVDGGPGGTGAGYSPNINPAMQSYREAGWNVLIPTHRGTGNSTPLECGNNADETGDEAALIECAGELSATWGDDLQHFSSTEAANDICRVVSMRDLQSRVVLVGVSYGSYLVQRVIKACEELFDSFVFDGAVAIDSNFEEDSIRLVSKAGNAVFGMCDQDTTCSSRFGGVPLGDVYDQLLNRILNDGHCSVLIDEDESAEDLLLNTKTLVSVLLGTLGELGPVVVPALIYRLDRCEPEDIQAIIHMAELIFPSDNETTYRGIFFNEALGINVYLSEIMQTSLSVEDILPQFMQERFLPVNGLFLERALIDAWPVPSLSTVDRSRASTSKPVLIMNNELDTATYVDWASSMADTYAGDNQYFLRLPGTTHALVPSDAEEDPTGNIACAHQVFLSFAEAGSFDDSCIDGIVRIQWGIPELNAELASFIFGAGDLWEG